MKMAKASKADLEMAMELTLALDAVSKKHYPDMPPNISSPEEEGFSLDNDEQCRRVCEYLIRLNRSASLFRVVWGCAVMGEATIAKQKT